MQQHPTLHQLPIHTTLLHSTRLTIPYTILHSYSPTYYTTIPITNTRSTHTRFTFAQNPPREACLEGNSNTTTVPTTPHHPSTINTACISTPDYNTTASNTHHEAYTSTPKMRQLLPSKPTYPPSSNITTHHAAVHTTPKNNPAYHSEPHHPTTPHTNPYPT